METETRVPSPRSGELWRDERDDGGGERVEPEDGRDGEHTA